MLHVFIDTNVLLRFYAYSDDTLGEVEKLSALVKAGQITLCVTQQVVDERARNRDKELIESMRRIEQLGASVQIPRFAEHHPAAADFSAAMKQAKKAKTDLVTAIKAEMQGEGLRADRVIQKLFEASHVLERTPEIVQRANLRRELGNPPGKRDSLGDQINWEIMLEHVPLGTDLHVVSRDGDFKGGILDDAANFFLKDEWHQRKKASLFLYSGLSEFAKIHFPDIKVPSDAIKNSALKKLYSSASFAQTHAAIAELQPILEEIAEDEAVALLVALTQNNQISGIITDIDVRTFYKDLYYKYMFSVSAELDKHLEEISSDIFGVPF